MVKEKLNLKMAHFLEEIFLMILLKNKEKSISLTKINIKESFMKAKNMGKENTYLQMGIFIKVSGKMIVHVEWEQ